MGCWGLRLFQSDHDYDIIEELNKRAGVELFFYETEEGEAQARKVLNDGVLARMFDELVAMGEERMNKITIFGALAMRVGANLDESQLLFLRCIYKGAGLLSEAEQQMSDALKSY